MTSDDPLNRFVFKTNHVQFSERLKELEVCLLLFISIFPLNYWKVGATYAVLHASRKSSRIVVSYAIVSVYHTIREVHKVGIKGFALVFKAQVYFSFSLSQRHNKK